MSSGDIRRVSRQDIQLVQNLIERCLQLYMNQKEVVQTLLSQAKIEPGFTELVWQKLEEQNQEFFKAYHVRLMLKNQIVLFNQLLEQQVQLMRETKTPVIAVAPQNGSGASTLNQLPFQYSSTARGDYSNGSVHPPNIVNGGPPLHQGVQIPAHPHVSALNTGRADIPTNVLPAEGHNMQMVNGMKGTTMKLEPDYLSTSQFPFCSDGAFLSDQQPQIDDRSGASFSGGQLSPDHLAEPLVDSETFGFLSQIPRNLSFSDLADHFNIDASEGPGRSAAFCVPEHNNFPGSPTGKCEGENKRLDAIAEGATYN